jgi:hypothetical protein
MGRKAGTGSPEVGSAVPITCRSSAPVDRRGNAMKYFQPGTARDCLDVGRDANSGAVGTFY